PRQMGRLVGRHAAKKGCHQQGRRLVVGPGALGDAADERLDLRRLQGVAVALLPQDVHRSHGPLPSPGPGNGTRMMQRHSVRKRKVGIMIDDWLSDWHRWVGGRPCLRIHGKARGESRWRILNVYATRRRDRDGRWPLTRGTCIAWTSE